MRPRLLQGRGHASIRAKRVVVAARSEKRAILPETSEQLRYERFVVATATSACQWRFIPQGCCRAGAVDITPWHFIHSIYFDAQKSQVVSA